MDGEARQSPYLTSWRVVRGLSIYAVRLRIIPTAQLLCQRTVQIKRRKINFWGPHHLVTLAQEVFPVFFAHRPVREVQRAAVAFVSFAADAVNGYSRPPILSAKHHGLKQKFF